MTGVDLFAGGGDMGEIMRSTDWCSTKLGAVDTWPKVSGPCLVSCSAAAFPWGEGVVGKGAVFYITLS